MNRTTGATEDHVQRSHWNRPRRNHPCVRTLFAAKVCDPVPQRAGYNESYVLSPDGQRFLMNTITEAASSSPIKAILNWKPQQWCGEPKR